jgi:hypothetical protein
MASTASAQEGALAAARFPAALSAKTTTSLLGIFTTDADFFEHGETWQDVRTVPAVQVHERGIRECTFIKTTVAPDEYVSKSLFKCSKNGNSPYFVRVEEYEGKIFRVVGSYSERPPMKPILVPPPVYVPPPPEVK